MQRGTAAWKTQTELIAMFEAELSKATIRTEVMTQTLKNLGTATPAQLNEALKVLNAQLQQTQRGTMAFDVIRERIKTVEQQIRATNLDTITLEQTFLDLDKASPRMLASSIATLKAQMQEMSGGSAAWDSHRQKVAQLETRLRELNLDMTQVRNTLYDFRHATPRELETALATLKAQLQDIKVGSAAWDDNRAKIKMLEEELKRIRLDTAVVKDTFADLNKATPQMLQQSLATLKAQLQSLEPNSKAWDAHKEKILIVEQRMKELNLDTGTLRKTLASLNTATPKMLETSLKTLEAQLKNTPHATAEWYSITEKIKQVRHQIEVTKQDTTVLNATLRNLNKATPSQLQTSLKILKAQLEDIKRGSAAWNAHVNKIRQVEAELAQVNSQLRVQKTFSERAMDWFNKWQMAIMGVAAALTGVIMAARKAVSDFAEMDEAMANTRKFTGMTREEVDDLNEAFKRMDTRTARQTLNDLAQEAGRLGKTTREDVLGYVQAADIINVALSDLGEGATQSIAKLSNIFKLEDEYGTYDSMVKIGSVVNVLSQNCTASKPYLVEFANRLAGVGNQAHLSLQNIIGMGAVLDANAQKVEASATAIGQVLTRMYRDPAKYARVAGLDVQNFTELLKTDANEALLTFLETLGKAGDLDVLSPMFKDMGENGARVITALATLSKHVDEVRWQQNNANKAFEEGTSVLHEYEIFNNTAQASIDKARKRVTELAIELGQKLYPMMKYITSSGTLMLRAINAVVDFLISHKREIVSVMYAIAAYTVVVNANRAAHLLWAGTVKVVNVVSNTVKATLIALRTVYYTLTNQIRKAEVATKAFNATSKRSLWGAIAAAIALVVAQIVQYIEKMQDAADEAERIRKENEEWKKSLEDIEESSAEYAKNEVTRLDSLYKAATDEANAKEKRKEAAEALQRLYPDYFKNLSTEAIMVGEAKVQYDKLRQSIIDVARAKAAAELIQKNEAELLKLEDQRDAAQSDVDKRRQQKEAADRKTRELHEKYDKEIQGAALGDSREMKSNNIQNKIGQINAAADASRQAASNLAAAENTLQGINTKIDEVNAANQRLAKKYNISVKTLASGNLEVPEEPETPPGGYTHTETEAEKKKRLAEERKRQAEAARQARKEKKEFQDALKAMKGSWEAAYAENLALYSQGKLTYRQYLDANRKADEEYFEDRLALFKASALEEDEDYFKLLKGKEEMATKWLDTFREMDIHEIQRTQQKDEAKLNMQFNDPTSAMYQQEKALQEGLHRIRLKALQDIQAQYKQGSKEWAQYQEQIEDEEASYALEKQRIFSHLSPSGARSTLMSPHQSGRRLNWTCSKKSTRLNS